MEAWDHHISDPYDHDSLADTTPDGSMIGSISIPLNNCGNEVVRNIYVGELEGFLCKYISQ